MKYFGHIHPLFVNGAGLACDQKTSKFFVLCGRIQGWTRGYKWNLLKFREEKYKGKHVGLGGSQKQESMFLLFRCF
jgi:hypothetical protein